MKQRIRPLETEKGILKKARAFKEMGRATAPLRVEGGVSGAAIVRRAGRAQGRLLLLARPPPSDAATSPPASARQGRPRGNPANLRQPPDAGWVAVRPKKRHTYPVGGLSHAAGNHLGRHFEADKPNQKWVGGITYLWASTGWAGLAVVLDLSSRKVVGWPLPDSPALILAAPNQAVILRQVTRGIGLLFHSGQGCQYTSHAYQDRLAGRGIQASTGRRGNCWDNAVMERFFRSLKVEAISRGRHQTQDGMKWAVKKHIHFYNNGRIHSTIGFIPPNQYGQVFLKQA